MGEGGGKLRRGLQEDCESKSGPFDEPSEWVGVCVCVCERERQALLWEMLVTKYGL